MIEAVSVMKVVAFATKTSPLPVSLARLQPVVLVDVDLRQSSPAGKEAPNSKAETAGNDQLKQVGGRVLAR